MIGTISIPQCTNAFKPSRLIVPVRPDYPDIAGQQGAQGRVIILVAVDARGSILNAGVEQSSRNAALDQAAM